jgi:DNA-binding protein H-NS
MAYFARCRLYPSKTVRRQEGSAAGSPYRAQVRTGTTPRIRSRCVLTRAAVWSFPPWDSTAQCGSDSLPDAGETNGAKDDVNRQLLKLKGEVEAVLSSKITEERRALEAELSKLSGFQDGKGRSKSAFGRGGPRGAVAPKYRNPENPAETWAGRGLRPRRLAAAIKGGKKLEDFAIAPAGEKAAAKAPKGRKKARKARK